MKDTAYSNDNLFRYTMLKYIENNYQNFKEITKEIKPQLTRKAYRKLKNWSEKENLENLYKHFSSRSFEELNSYNNNLNSWNIKEELKHINEELEKIRKVYSELQALETKFSEYPLKEKYGKKSTEIKQMIWEMREKKDELRALCGTTRPFTKIGRMKLNSVTKNPEEAIAFRNIVINPNSVKLIPKGDSWVKHQDKYYKKEMASYSKYVKKHRFIKITDDSLQGALLATCINNENPQLIPLEESVALIARTYQRLYDICLKIDKDLATIPEIRSQIQKRIINHLVEALVDYPTNHLGRDKHLHSNISHFHAYGSNSYVQKLRNFMQDEKFEYKKIKNTTIDYLKEYEEQIKTETNELKKQLTPVAYSKFKEDFLGFGDLIQQVKKHPYQDLKKFSNDILEKSKDLLERKIEQINAYRDETVSLYCKKKELEKTLKNFSHDKRSEEYNLVIDEKIHMEKRLKTHCGTFSPFTDRGKQMIYIRSREENVRIYNRLSYVLSEQNSSITDKRPLKAILDQTKEKQRSRSGSTEHKEAKIGITRL